VDLDGKVLGQHEGIHNYTIGQRKGLGIAAAHPLYVVALDTWRNQVVVGDRASVHHPDCTVNRVNWVGIAAPASPVRAQVQVRYRTRPAEATLVPLDGGRIRVKFDEPLFGITPGQAAVWYDGDVLLGGGIIEASD
jgi:tRNA-specific 2-thiouridylase